jgi:hypothetical protein
MMDQVFTNTFIWAYDDIMHLSWNLNKKVIPCNFCMLDEKQEWIKYFKWMNASIAFGEPNVVEVNVRCWKNKFLQYSHIRTMPRTKGAPWWRYAIQLYACILNTFYA